MDQFKELPREAQITLGCLVLFVILSFTILLGLRFAPWGAAVGGAPARPRSR